MTLTKLCAKCALADLRQNKCKLTSRTIVPTADFCSSFADHPCICEICGKITMSPLLETYNDNTYVFCHKCSDAISTCNGCANADPQLCAFQTDPSALPLYKTVTQRQGNIVTQTQIPNPERQAQTCALGCKCWDAKDKVCNKEENICANYTVNEKLFTAKS